jgi:hypothetical protein
VQQFSHPKVAGSILWLAWRSVEPQNFSVWTELMVRVRVRVRVRVNVRVRFAICGCCLQQCLDGIYSVNR